MNTVLLVEDSQTEADFVGRCLQQAGLYVVSATSTDEARTRLQQHKPDLIVLDVILPGQSGFEWCRELKSTAQTSSIPVVIRSSKSTEADQLWGKMLGADAYVPKSESYQALVQTVQKLLRS
ncbi:response regulator [Leptolyngbya sp. FACHB-711]|uniref:response regulator transcription factor n=1 Tax=unclassified Leptolyngbya TaxID=2650499 RepID=UPI001682CCD7|nr:response regulator [Leptolyngbya sp. FACHB-711]MBD1849032.1 response regulator [Cyanobacteria bacterium FACHB-502]MBD2027893.1 response regulator [Leptolyngbya sp. FACHB-711]